MRKLVLVTVAVFTVLAVAASTVLAARGGPGVHSNAGQGQQACTGTLASGEYHKLVVPAGATCDGTTAEIDVRGGVRVGEGATFILGEDHGPPTGTIRGGVQANAPAVRSERCRSGITPVPVAPDPAREWPSSARPGRGVKRNGLRSRPRGARRRGSLGPWRPAHQDRDRCRQGLRAPRRSS